MLSPTFAGMLAQTPQKSKNSVMNTARVQVYSTKAANKWNEYPDYIDTEDKSTTAFIFEHPDIFKIGYLQAKDKWAFMNKPDFTFAVNYRKNFELICRIFEKNYPLDSNFGLDAVMAQIKQEPDLINLMGSE